MIIASYLLLAAYGFLAILPEKKGSYEGVYGMILIGISTSIFSTALYPCLMYYYNIYILYSYTVNKNHLSTAYGLSMSVSNFALAIGPPFVEIIKDATKSGDKFFWVGIFFVSLLTLSLFITIWLFFYDWTHGRILYKRLWQNANASVPIEEEGYQPINIPPTCSCKRSKK